MVGSDEERKTGIVTKNQRRYLEDEKQDLSERGEEQIQIRIRQRLRNALVDSSLLYRTLDEEAVEAVFSPAPHANEGREEVVDGALDLIGLCYVGLSEDLHPSLVLEEAIRRGSLYRGKPTENVTVDIEIEYSQPTEDLVVRVGGVSDPDEDEREEFEKRRARQYDLLTELAEYGALDVEKLVEKEYKSETLEQWLIDRGHLSE